MKTFCYVLNENLKNTLLASGGAILREEKDNAGKIVYLMQVPEEIRTTFLANQGSGEIYFTDKFTMRF